MPKSRAIWASSSAEKWDFTRLPFDPTISGASACGERLRRDVTAAMGEMPNLPVRIGRDAVWQRLLEELWPIMVRGLEAGLNTLIRQILKRIR
ncbi:hypothetical protein NKI79_31785 [Mesorhizobium sp. M0340]|uniref:hypothetical protein n=1 Tax=Mesorhizobium sp. M0340 TaxID=2956939 RepID=UPI00333B8628